MKFQNDVLDVRGIKTRVLSAGNGPVILFLHGAGGVPASAPLLEMLGRDRRLIVPEHPGFGTSEAPKSIRTVSDVALHYLDLMDLLDLSDVNILGQSLGGWIAAETAVANPARVRTFSLIAPTGVRMRGVPVADNFMWSPEEAVRNLYHNQTLADEILARPQSEEQVDMNLANHFMTARLAWEPRWHDPSLARWLHRINKPTHIIWGAQDRFVPKAYAGYWGELIPNARVTILDDCGHLPLAEKPVETSRVVHDFIESVRG